MGEIAFTTTIAGKAIPLKIEEGKEALVTQAAEMLNNMLTTYQTQYKVKAKEDLLAMCALRLAVEQEEARHYAGELLPKVAATDSLLSALLAE